MKALWNRQIQPDRTVLLRNGKIGILIIFYHVFFNFHGSDPRVAKLISGLSRLSTDEKRSMRPTWNRQTEFVPKMLLSSFSERSEAEICSWKPSTTYVYIPTMKFDQHVVKYIPNLDFSKSEYHSSIRLNLTISGSFHDPQKLGWNVFYGRFTSKNTYFDLKKLRKIIFFYQLSKRPPVSIWISIEMGSIGPK